jgi:rifampicin phosphotransferase
MVADRWITDWPLAEKYPLYTRANAGEVLPDPCSPLGWSLTWEPPGCLRGWRDSAVHDYCAVTADEMSQDRPEAVGHFGGYLYINATSVRLFGARGPGLTPEAIDLVYLGSHPDAPPYVAEPWHENEACTAAMGAWMAAVMGTADLPELRDDQALARQLRDDRPDLATLSAEQLVQRMRAMVPHLGHLFRRHLTVTAGSSIGPGVLGAVGEALGQPDLALQLISSVGDVDSALPSQAMWRLSRLAPDSAAYAAGFAEFIHEYGSRGPNEWDIRSETWETQPSLATSLIDVMRKAGDDDDPLARSRVLAATREGLATQVRAALASAPDTLTQFEAGLASAHAYLAGRERAKTNVIMVMNEVRVCTRELAARFDYTSSQVCMLLADELDAFASDADGFRPRLVAREQQYLELFDLEPPFILNGRVPPLSEWPRAGAHRAATAHVGEQLTGVPGCPGVAEGRARVILDPSDPLALEPGDILIAPITDPAWTPLFIPSAAVVVNVGAQVSHAVIVSRELGIPCVVSVIDATQRIPDGAIVRVDGAAGTVTVLSLDT